MVFDFSFQDSGRRNITAFWLGASDTDIDGIWKWVATDEELSFSEWDVRSVMQ
jgi:hypothetical protein